MSNLDNSSSKGLDSDNLLSSLNSLFFGKVSDSTFEFGKKNKKKVLLCDISFLEVVCVKKRKIKIIGIVSSLFFCLFFVFLKLYFFLVLVLFPFVYFSFFYNKKKCFIQIIYKVPARDIIVFDYDEVSEAKVFVSNFNHYLVLLSKSSCA